jgi:hypothetical protein
MTNNGALASITHGIFGTPEHTARAQMIQRCCNPKHPAWLRYGGRDITVCERWRKFKNFYADMGPRPPGWKGKRPLYSLDRNEMTATTSHRTVDGQRDRSKTKTSAIRNACVTN